MRTYKGSSRKKKDKHNFEKKFFTKRWLRQIIMRALRFWAPLLHLDALVDTITIYIAESNDESVGEGAGACVLIDHTRRSANIRIKINIVEAMAAEYPGIVDPEEIAEMTIIHELNHIITNPMSDWVFNTVKTMTNHKILDNLFEQEEESVVEHMTRVLFHAYRKKRRTPTKRFKGKIIYLAKDPEQPTKKEEE